MNELLSIIIPVYNVEKYLDKCIQSIISLEGINYELILVDDGSVDKSGEICLKYSSQYENVFLIQSMNEGPGLARNKGLKIARGVYITFVDADDYIEKNYYIDLIKIMTEKDLDIIQGSYYEINEDDKMNRKMCHNIEVSGSRNCCDEYIRRVSFDNYVWNKIFKREIVKHIEFPNIFYSEDQCYLTQAFHNANKVGAYSVDGYYHLVQSNSLCNSAFSVKKLDVLKAVNIMDDYLRANALDCVDFLSIDACSYVVRFYPYVNAKDKELLNNVFNKYYPIYAKKVCKKYSSLESRNSLKKKLLLMTFRISPVLSSFLVKSLKIK